MKLNHKHKEWLARHARFSAARKLSHNRRAKEHRVNDLRQYLSGDSSYAPGQTRPVIVAPADFSLTTNYDGVLKFIDSLRELAIQRKQRLSLEFKTIKSISPAAALMLAAEVDRWRIMRKIKLRPKEINKWDSDVRRLLCEKGFFNLLDVPDPGYEPPRDPETSIQMIRFLTGNINDGKPADSFRAAIDKVAGTVIAKDHLAYEGLMEATLNSVQHAYPDDVRPETPWVRRQWWMSGSYDGGQKRVTIMVYDQGVGIPKTLPSYKFFERLTEWLTVHKLPVNHHGSMIQAAMGVSRSSIDSGGRGNGLAKIRDFVDNNIDGRLRILSGQGEYLYESNGKELVLTHDRDFGGTLIQWEIAV